MTEQEQERFGLYVHWPFCAAKCPYCDFNSHVSLRVDHDRWANALVSEIERSARETRPRKLDSIFFGGGTPSLMQPETVEAVIAAARGAWSFSNDIEITLEANPSSVEAERFAGFRAAGVSRISIGIQSLNDDHLRNLGRLHTVDEALRALDVARGLFERVSFDLIYARQDQFLRDWDEELRRALSFDPSHLSLYQLTIEDGTAFGERFAAGKLRGLPDEDLSVELFELTQELCDGAGLPAYEVSNHARPGAESRHNLIYWTGGDWVGVGPGAHGRLTLGDGRFATETHLMPVAWLGAVEAQGTGESSRRALDPEGVLQEFLLMGLRLADGISMKKFASLAAPEQLAKTSELVGRGYLEDSNDRLRATPAGKLLLNRILREILVP